MVKSRQISASDSDWFVLLHFSPYFANGFLTFSLQVAWIHIDRQMILTIHRHVISKIPRYSITYDNANTWQLHVNQAQQDDRGYYMCQVSKLLLNSANVRLTRGALVHVNSSTHQPFPPTPPIPSSSKTKT